MTAVHQPTRSWAAAPRSLLASFDLVTTLLVGAVVTVVLLAATRPTADVGGFVQSPPAKTCPGGPPNADC